MKTSLLLSYILAPIFLSYAAAQENPYRLGSSWGKKSFSHENASELPKLIKKQAASMAKFLGGTAFYLGKFNGRHLMATNYHVLPSPMNCISFAYSEFAITNESFACKKFIASFPSIELSLYEIKVRPGQEEGLKKIGIKIRQDTRAKGLLYGLGYGLFGNPSPMRKHLLLSRDPYCTAFSKEVRLLGDPDELNPVPYKVWSQPIGCDFSHGDSGAAVLNEHGEFAGIFWTGAVPKPARAQDDTYLAELLLAQDSRQDSSQDSPIWKELSYMVPAYKIISVIGDFLLKHPEHKYFRELSLLVQKKLVQED